MEFIYSKYQEVISQNQQGSRPKLRLTMEEWSWILESLGNLQQLELQKLKPLLSVLAHFYPSPAERAKFPSLPDQPLLMLFNQTSDEEQLLLILQIFNLHLWPRYVQNARNLPADHLNILRTTFESRSLVLKTFCLNLVENLGQSVRPLALEFNRPGGAQKCLYFAFHPSTQKRLWNKSFRQWLMRWS